MRTQTIAVAAVAFAASVAVAEPARPRFYFPKYVKRQFVNETTTRESPFTTTTIPSLSSQSSTTRRDLTDLLSGDQSGFTSSGERVAPSASNPDDPTSTGDAKHTTVTSVVLVTAPPEPVSTSDPGLSLGLGLSLSLPSSEGLPAIIIQPTSTSPASTTETPSSSTVASVSTDDESTTGIVIAPTGLVTSSTSTPEPTSSTVATSSSVEPVSSTSAAVTTAPEVTSSALVTSAPEVTTTPVPTTTPGVLLPISSLVSELSSLLVPNTTETTAAPPTETPPPVTSTPDTVPTSTEPPPTSLPPTSLPPTDTGVPTTLPPASSTDGSTNGTVTVPPTTAPPESTLEPATTSNATSTTEIPITTGPTSNPTPSSIVIDTGMTAPPTQSVGALPTTTQAVPSSLPKAITPDDADAPIPEDFTTIHIVLDGALHFQFVSSNQFAIGQINEYIPRALAFYGNYKEEQSKIRSITYFDTRALKGYLATVVYVTFPTNLIDDLRADIKWPTTLLYQNPDEMVRNLTMHIDSGFDILGTPDLEGPGGGGTTGTGGSVVNNGGPGAPGGGGGGDPITGAGAPPPAAEQTPQQKGVTAGIVAGGVLVATAYGAAMFLVARRYKRRKQSHRRSSSISNGSSTQDSSRGPRSDSSSSMSEFSGDSPVPMMGGALIGSPGVSSYGGTAMLQHPGGRDSHGSDNSGRTGGSAKTAFISGPMSAENSLGWN